MPVLLADTGNFSDTPTPQGNLKTEALLEAMERLGYQVINVGERDIRLGYDEFASRTSGSKLQFVSANIVRQETQQPVFPPHAVVETSSSEGTGRLKIGVIGVVRYNPLFLKTGPDESSIVIAHPVERVRHEMDALRAKGVDLVVLLAALHQNDAKAIADAVPGIDFVLGSYGGMVSNEAEKQGKTSILYSGNKGQRIGETRVFLDERKAVLRDHTRMHFLTVIYPADRDMLNFVNSIPVRDDPDAVVPGVRSGLLDPRPPPPTRGAASGG